MVPQPALAYPPSHDGEHQGKGCALRPHSGAKVAALSATASAEGRRPFPAPTQWRQIGAHISGLGCALGVDPSLDYGWSQWLAKKPCAMLFLRAALSVHCTLPHLPLQPLPEGRAKTPSADTVAE